VISILVGSFTKVVLPWPRAIVSPRGLKAPAGQPVSEEKDTNYFTNTTPASGNPADGAHQTILSRHETILNRFPLYRIRAANQPWALGSRKKSREKKASRPPAANHDLEVCDEND
jgi:hypothetical protein